MNVCVQLSVAVNVTVSFSVPSANNLIVTEAAGVPNHVFVTGISNLPVIVFVTTNPVAALPVIAFT